MVFIILTTAITWLPALDKNIPVEKKLNFRDEMRKFVIELSRAGKKMKPGFLIIPQNAVDIITVNGERDGPAAGDYIASIDGLGLEELFFGTPADGAVSPKTTADFLIPFLKILKNRNRQILIIDYVKTSAQAESSYQKSEKYGFLSFQAERSLSMIPGWIKNPNRGNIASLKDAKNFLFMINGSKFINIHWYMDQLKKSDWDILIIDLFFHGTRLTNEQVNSLKIKKSGGKRLVISYLSIGEAEDYRYYWKPAWKKSPPPFLEKENPEWKGNYKVKYWMDEWKEIITGKADGTGFSGSYVKQILDAGFDGVYLDIIDAAFYFEKKNLKDENKTGR